ncbi:MAG: hypothetical protein AAGK98_07675 [Pseudomonadota bacterium]
MEEVDDPSDITTDPQDGVAMIERNEVWESRCRDLSSHTVRKRRVLCNLKADRQSVDEKLGSQNVTLLADPKREFQVAIPGKDLSADTDPGNVLGRRI